MAETGYKRAYFVNEFLKLDFLKNCLFFFFSGHATRHVGSQLPSQGQNPGPCVRKVES